MKTWIRRVCEGALQRHSAGHRLALCHRSLGGEKWFAFGEALGNFAQFQACREVPAFGKKQPITNVGMEVSSSKYLSYELPL
jgi:hypothetical protein